ncbi:MAG: glycosyl hydrolase [Gammaproteobacteria bacterium]|nr:glycosyl hydrolase [Gammaproteobacteria bacterium]
MSNTQAANDCPWQRVTLLISTRKGAFIATSDDRREWHLSQPIMLGHTIHHLVLDPRDQRTLLMAASTGHLGPTIFRSHDFGVTWQEAHRPPAFPPPFDGQKPLTVNHVFWLTPSTVFEPDVWYAGTSPQGLFRSSDGGVNWDSVNGFNQNINRSAWCGGDKDGTPDGPKMHSIIVDPRDNSHLYIGMSSGGIFESTDWGNTWYPLNQGVAAEFIPIENPLYGHDPHCVRMSPADPDRLYHQNHCGIYRLDRPDTVWRRIGDNMPSDIGDIGFPMVLHPTDKETCWVFPMDGTAVWPRVSPGGRPAAYMTSDGGDSWLRWDKGLPKKNAWWTVKRQAMTADACHKPGVYFGTTSGELWAARNPGGRWRCIASHLPEIYAIEAVVAT